MLVAKLAVLEIYSSFTASCGWFAWLICGWIFLMFMDYLTSFAAACKAGKWKRKMAIDGLWHKTGEIVVVIVAGTADLLLGLVLDHLPVFSLPIDLRGMICPLVLVWYIVTEIGSIIESAGTLGAPIPPWLAKVVAALHKSVDEKGNKIMLEDHEDKTE